MLICLLTLARVGWTQDPEATDSLLTVEGNGVVRVSPDLAVVRLGVVAQSRRAEDAQEAVNTVANQIISALIEAGVESADVQTSRLNLTPVYTRGRPDGNQPPSIASYRASNTLTVRVEALDRVGAVIDAALEAGANQLEGVSFELQDEGPSRQAALREAVGAARAKAEVIADALGVRLSSILSVDEGTVRMNMPMMESRAMALQEVAPTAVSPGEVSVAASVVVRYRIQSE